MEQYFGENVGGLLTHGGGMSRPEVASIPAILPSTEMVDMGVDFGWWSGALQSSEEYQYRNAATCPDCGAGMVRLGTCYSCPGCGWGSCGG